MKIKVQQEIEINIEAIMMLMAKKAEKNKTLFLLDYKEKSLDEQIIKVMKKLYGVDLIYSSEDEEENDEGLIEEIKDEIDKRCFSVYANEISVLMFIKDNEMYFIYDGLHY